MTNLNYAYMFKIAVIKLLMEFYDFLHNLYFKVKFFYNFIFFNNKKIIDYSKKKIYMSVYCRLSLYIKIQITLANYKPSQNFL